MYTQRHIEELTVKCVRSCVSDVYCVCVHVVSPGVQVVGWGAGVCGSAAGGGCEEQLSLEPAALCHLPHHRLYRAGSPRQRSTVSVTQFNSIFFVVGNGIPLFISFARA